MRIFIQRAQIALAALIWTAFLSNIQAEGGCGTGFWRCGDICISVNPLEDNVTKPVCHCGSAILDTYRLVIEQTWCCSDEPCDGLGSFYHHLGMGSGYTGGGNCTNGKVLHLSQPCKGKCNANDNDLDTLLFHSRTTEPCATANNVSDVTQCIPQREKNNNVFTCINRADENPFATYDTTDMTSLDLNVILTSCTTGPSKINLRAGVLPGSLGLRCPHFLYGPEECAPLWTWCKRSNPTFCDYGRIGFLISDRSVCSNASFWQQHTCGDSKYKRCNGTNPGQCIGVDQECDEDLPDQPHLNPTDKTLDLDNLLPHCDYNFGIIGQSPGLRCPKEVFGLGCLPLSSWCQTESSTKDCGYGIYSTDPRICQNMTFWKNKYCPESMHRCNGANPGQCGHAIFLPCSDGSDRVEPLPEIGHCGEKLKCHRRQNLTVRNSRGELVIVGKKDEVCLDKKLICDLHPQCQGGEDEDREECVQAYLDKGFFRQDETFICPYPFHEVTLLDGKTKKLYTHRAIRCNAKPECWGGEDEKGCNVIEAIAQYIIRKFSLK